MTPLAQSVRRVIHRLDCRCWDFDSMEADPAGPCPRCELQEAIDQHDEEEDDVA